MIVGKLYREVEDGKSDAVRETAAVRMFEETGENRVRALNCTKLDGDVISVSEYTFGEGAAFKAEWKELPTNPFFRNDEQNPNHDYSYYNSFDKEIGTPGQIVVTYVDRDIDETWGMKAEYQTDGQGYYVSKSISKELTEASANHVFFTDEGGASLVADLSSGETYKSYSFFNAGLRSVSLLELPSSLQDKAKDYSVELPTDRNDGLFVVPTFGDDLTCHGDVVDVTCPVGKVAYDKATDEPGAPAPKDCDPNDAINVDDNYFVVKDDLNRVDKRLLGKLSLDSQGAGDGPTLQDVVGIRIIVNDDEETVDVTTKFTVELPNSLEAVDAATYCAGTTPDAAKAPASGFARTQEEVCALSVTYPLLVKVVAVDKTEVTFAMKAGVLTANPAFKVE
jgi:hypothetical protein